MKTTERLHPAVPAEYNRELGWSGEYWGMITSRLKKAGLTLTLTVNADEATAVLTDGNGKRIEHTTPAASLSITKAFVELWGEGS